MDIPESTLEGADPFSSFAPETTRHTENKSHDVMLQQEQHQLSQKSCATSSDETYHTAEDAPSQHAEPSQHSAAVPTAELSGSQGMHNESAVASQGGPSYPTELSTQEMDQFLPQTLNMDHGMLEGGSVEIANVINILSEAKRQSDSVTPDQAEQATDETALAEPMDTLFHCPSTPAVEPLTPDAVSNAEHEVQESLSEAVRPSSLPIQAMEQGNTDMPNICSTLEPSPPKTLIRVEDWAPRNPNWGNHYEATPKSEDENTRDIPYDPGHSHKRNFELSSPAEASPPANKRIRLLSPALSSAPINKEHHAVPVFKPPFTFYNQENGVSREEIGRHTGANKQLLSHNQTDTEADTTLLDRLSNYLDGEYAATPETISSSKPTPSTAVQINSLLNPPVQPSQEGSQVASSPLSDLDSADFLSSTFASAQSTTQAEAKMQTTQIPASQGTQTETVWVFRVEDLPGYETKDTSSWENELRSIQRPEPLFRGDCITVNVPLRIRDPQRIVKNAPSSMALRKSGIQEHEIITIPDSPPPEAPVSRYSRPSRHAVNRPAHRLAQGGRGRTSNNQRLNGDISNDGTADGVPSHGAAEMDNSGELDNSQDYLNIHIKRRYVRDEPENIQFYGYTVGTAPQLVEKELRYQDRYTDVGEIPGPKSGLRLQLDKYVRDSGIKSATGLENKIEHALKRTYYGSQTFNEEQAFTDYWKKDREITLLKGFPLVESVPFAALGNYGKPDGDCYWSALAYILQGNRKRWNVVKAEHLEYLYHVLSDKTHPRYDLYANKLNTRFFESHGATVRDSHLTIFKANLWQLLHLPHSWTPGVMQQITADLYNIHLVTFGYNSTENLCTEVNVRGAYNSRHVFMLFLDNEHFQPLTPNEHLSWEFRYPRVTVVDTARYANAPKPGTARVKNARQHPWRNDWTREVPPPVPRNHGCDLHQLSQLM